MKLSRSAMGAIVLITIVVLAVYLINRSKESPGTDVGSTPTALLSGNTPAPGQSGLAPTLGKPPPVTDYFNGCPPSGDGGDPVLNTLKNRLDEAAWQPATVADILALTWPSAIEQQPRSRWSAADRQVISQHEGTPVQVEGYLVDVKKQSPESCNCHSVDYVDYHMWLVDDTGKSRSQSVVIEASPRVRSYHSSWTLTNLRNLVSNKTRVRISGWLLMDPEHPDQIGKTRGTIWEVHPVMQIETQRNGVWVALDNGTTGIHSGPAVAQTLPTVVPESTATTPSLQIIGRQDNSAVKITNLFYNAVKGNTEPDEYVEITNTGSQPVDITDWVLKDPKGDDEYKWESFTIQPGQVIDVYTNEVHPESGGFTFASSHAVWANSGGVAELYDSDKQLVSRYAYGNQK